MPDHFDRNEDKKEFAALVSATLKVYRAEADREVLKLWWAVLARYKMADVRAGFSAFLSSPSSKFQPVPADIVGAIDKAKPDGRPGADEAWAMIPRDEYASCVMTEEMAHALRVAQPLLNEGDQVAARMAFKESYARLVDAAKRAGTPVKWFPSLGQDKEAREACLAEAVRLGRLGAEHAIGLLPPDKVAPMLEQAGNKALAIEHKPGTSEVARQNIAKMKAMLAGSRVVATDKLCHE